MKLTAKTSIPKEMRFQTPPLEGDLGGGKSSYSIQSFQNLYYSAHFFIICHDLDAVRVCRGAGEYAFHHTFCNLTSALMVFLNESHIHAGLDVSAFRFHPIKVGKDSLFLSKKHKKEDLSAFRSQHIKVVR